ATPKQLVLFRFLPTIPFFLVLTVGFRRSSWSTLRTLPKMLPHMFLFGLFGVVFYNFALNTGQTKLPSSLAALVISLNPTAIAIVAALSLKELPRMRTWGGLFLGLIGIIIVVIGRTGTPELRHEYLVGVLITLGAPVSWGIYSTGLRRFAPQIGAVRATSLSMLTGTIPLLFLIDGKTVALLQSPARFHISYLFLGVVCTVFGFTGWAAVLKRLPAAQAGTFIYLVPLIAAIAGYTMLGEPLDVPLLLGGLLVLSGVALATGTLHQILRWFKIR
ncbi:EamA family transporter, partial [bacterium]|nr:EamA family transporter [bacterium]